MPDAIICTIDGVRSRASTQETLLVLAVPQEYARAVSGFLPLIGQQMACAFSLVTAKAKGTYGQQASLLRRSGFFRLPVVWPKIGTDQQFLEWLPFQPCSIAEERAGPHAGDVVAAHVRRIAQGAGTGLKPTYSAIPLCHGHHDLQHRKGESALHHDFDAERIRQLENWAWQTLKAQLGAEHWNEIDPAVMHQWASQNGVEHLLPADYR